MFTRCLLPAMTLAAMLAASPASAQENAPPALSDQPAGKWVKRSPLPTAPTSPRKGYESSMDWDPNTGLLIRHGGHNQGGGGAQYFEVWTLDPATMKWDLRHTNTSPPGVCCCKDNVFDHGTRRYIRFPAFSLSHGWQWNRMVAMRNWSAWSFDVTADRWRNMRPLPQRNHGPGRQAAYDWDNDVVVLFSSQGTNEKTSVYDVYTNTWHAMDPTPRPPARCYGGFCYDQAAGKFVLFGRHYGDDPKTWLYDLRENKWTALEVDPHPPSNRTAPVMAYDSLSNKVLAVMRTDAKDGQMQTWQFDTAARKWTKLDDAGDLGASGSRNRLLVFVPEHNAFVFENRNGSEQQIWTYRTAAVDRAKLPPARPAGVAVTVAADGKAELTWKPGDDRPIASYNVYRGSGETPWSADYKQVATGLTKAEFADADLTRGEIHYYRVAAVDANGREGRRSIPARTQPRALERIVVSAVGAKKVEVNWEKSAHGDVVGYHVERADVEVYTTAQRSDMAKQDRAGGKTPPVGDVKAIGQFKRLTDKPVDGPAFVDESVDLADAGHAVEGDLLYNGKNRRAQEGTAYRYRVYAYRVRPVNALGVEGGPSPFTLTIPSAVEDVYSKEDGKAVHLKWSANPEKNIAGYLVYRMNNRYDKTFPCLTPEPIRATEFTDPQAGVGKENSRRYFIVAVDGLGQEGVPSSPVWSQREWARYYEPFGAGIGTWHQ